MPKIVTYKKKEKNSGSDLNATTKSFLPFKV